VLVDLGEKELKNIARPMRAYAAHLSRGFAYRRRCPHSRGPPTRQSRWRDSQQPSGPKPRQRPPLDQRGMWDRGRSIWTSPNPMQRGSLRRRVSPFPRPNLAIEIAARTGMPMRPRWTALTSFIGRKRFARSLAEDLALKDIESREQGSDTMALVIVATRSGSSGGPGGTGRRRASIWSRRSAPRPSRSGALQLALV
jgi:hypothetical protein